MLFMEVTLKRDQILLSEGPYHKPIKQLLKRLQTEITSAIIKCNTYKK